MPDTESRATKNRLLSLLTDEEKARLSPSLGRAALHEGRVIFQMGEPVEWAYFPDGGIISVVCASAGGESVEVGMVGYEGVAGLPALLGDGVPHNKRAVVQVAGSGWVIEAGALRREFKPGGHFQGVLLRYAQAYHTLVSQSVFCQAFHHIDERLARWLLECQWRIESDELSFITANLAIGYTFSTLAQNQLQAMQMSLMFFLPNILLSGFMFPFAGMPVWAQWIGEALPLTHYLRIVRSIMLKGASLRTSITTPPRWPG